MHVVHVRIAGKTSREERQGREGAMKGHMTK